MAEDRIDPQLEFLIATEGQNRRRYRFLDGEVYDLQNAVVSYDGGWVIVASVVALVTVPATKVRFHRPGNALQFAPSHLEEVTGTLAQPPEVKWHA